MIVAAERELAYAGASKRLGRYQLEAAIQSVHSQRGVTGATNWEAILTLYTGLAAASPTIGALVGRAAAIAEAHGAEVGLMALDALPAEPTRAYQPFWALRAHLLARLGDPAARTAYATAIGLAEDPAVKAFLLARAEGSR